MKKTIAVLVTLSLMVLSSCVSTTSPQGGTLPQDKEFSIVVPTHSTVKQGESVSIVILLNRGSFFKKDVRLVIHADGLVVTPAEVLVKASEKPEAQLQITATRETALGEYRVYINATPAAGKTTSTECTVAVVAPKTP